jgi:flagellar protein FlaG
MEYGIATYSNNSIRRYTPVTNGGNDRSKSAVKELAAKQQASQKRLAAAAAEEAKERLRKSESAIDPDKYLGDILRFTSLFNRKLKFSINSRLEQVVVKVIDRETDKVIKEIPPEALQRLHERMQEFMGLLVDEEI